MDGVVDSALERLTAPGMAFAEAQTAVSSDPGLYAVHAAAPVWRDLGLGEPPDSRPLYIGKAERSLSSRDLRTHFSTGKTGWSTLRRSLAGLLADRLDLHGQPRNPADPGSFANFGLEAVGDARLTAWMQEHLRLAAWVAEPDVLLDEVETAVLREVVPPLNIDKVTSPWRDRVRAGRRRLADQARAWAPEAATGEMDETTDAPSAGPSGRVVGVDAAGRRGWVGVLVDDAGFQDARTGTLAEVLEWAEPFDVAGIDIPIGHLPNGVRQADVEARRFVGARRSSVFAAPPAVVLGAASYEEANARLAELGLPLLSQQAFALVPKIVEAAAVAAMDPRVFEVHPEVSFRAMADEGLAWSKRSWNGLLLRRRLLVDTGIELPDVIPNAGDVVADDVVDAAAAAWSARRIAGGGARSFPTPPEQHDDRDVAIWC